MRKLDLTQSSGAIAETLGVVVKASVEILIDEQHPTGHPPARLKKNHQNRLPGSSSQSQDNSAFQDSGVSQEKSASQGNTLFKDNTQATGNSQAPGNSQAKDNSPLHKDIRIRIKAVQLQRLKNADTALLTVDLMYLGAFGERSPVLFNGLHGRLALNLPKNWQLFTSYTLTFPLEVTQNLVELTLVRHPIGLGGAYNLMIGRTSLRLATSFHLDYVTHTQKSDVSEFVPQDKGGRLQVSVMPQALFSFKIAGPMAISVGLGAEIFLIRLKYSTTSENGEKTTIFQSWAVYPVMLLGLTGEF